MREALRLADIASANDEVPVGSVIMRGETIMGIGSNHNIAGCDPSAHAEIVALRDACKYANNYRIPGTVIYVTLEPCPMCFAALIQARIERLVFGAADPKGGYRRFFSEAAIDQFNHSMVVQEGLLQQECREKIQSFFNAKRQRGKRKWIKEG